MRSSPFHIRSGLPLAAMVFATPLVIWGAVSVSNNTADIAQWLPDGNKARQQYGQFVSAFGADNFVLVSWPGCTLDDERLDRFAAALERTDSKRGSGDGPLIRRIITARGLLEELTGPPLKLSRRSAIRRMLGTLVGRDGETAAMVVQPASAAGADQHAIVDMIFAEASGCGIQPDEMRIGGTAYKAVMIERESDLTLRRYAVPSCLVALLVAACCLRNLYLTISVLAAAGFAELLSLALVYYSGGQLNAVMIVIPPLIFVLTVSSAIHLINYYRDAIRERGIDHAARHALDIGWVPISLAAITTAIGLFSLGVSGLAPVRNFGVYAGVALICSLLIVLIFLPTALARRPIRQTNRAELGRRREVVRHYFGNRRGDRAAEWICRHNSFLLFGCLIVLVTLGYGLSRLNASVKLERSFAESSRFVRDYHWIEQNIGPLLAHEVLVSFDNACELSTLDRMELMTQVHAAVQKVGQTGGVMSPVSLSPPIPRPGGIGQTARRRVVAKKLEQARPELVDRGLIAVDDDGETWRLTARVPAMGDVDYASISSEIRRDVRSVLREHEQQQEGTSGIDVSYTGLSPLLDLAQHQLLDDLLKSFSMACLIICPVMMLVLRSFWGGLISMIPNVLPIVCVFGALGWLDFRIDIGAVLTASVALGIAVDGTLHFLTWYARGLRDGSSRTTAVRAAYQRCSSAMIQTTLICGLGISVFGLSSYTPASRFGWLIAVLLLAALIGDLILLPALLASPLGRVFEHRRMSNLAKPRRQLFPDDAASAARAMAQRIS